MRDLSKSFFQSTFWIVEDGFEKNFKWGKMKNSTKPYFFQISGHRFSKKPGPQLATILYHVKAPTYSSRHVEKERRQTRYPVGGEGFETSQKNSPCLSVDPLEEFFSDLFVNISVVLTLHITKQP